MGVSNLNKNSHRRNPILFLTYGMEAVLPLEVLHPSLRIQLDEDMTEDQRREALLLQLDLLDERRMKAVEHAQV